MTARWWALAACAASIGGTALFVAAPAGPALAAPARHPAQQQTPTPAPVTLNGVLRRGSSPNCPSVALWRLEPCDGSAPTLIGSPLSLESYADLEVTLTGRVRTCPGGGSYVDVSGVSAHPCAAPTAVAADPNLALGKPVQIPADNPDRNGGAINDGNAATAWRAPSDKASWLYIDLQAERNVHKFVLRWGAGHAGRFGIYMWDRAARVNGANGDWSALYYNPSGKGGDETIVVPAVKAQVFLLYLVAPPADQPGADFELREWEVYGADMPNLARGHHVEASTERPLNPAAYAVDGSVDTAWHGEPARASSQPTWLRVVYAPLRADISAVRILWDAGYASRYRVHFRADGQWLAAQFPIENDQSNEWNVISWRFPLSVDEVWIVIDRSVVTHDYVGIRELELNAQPPGQSAFSSLDPRRALTGDVVVTGARLMRAAMPIGDAITDGAAADGDPIARPSDGDAGGDAGGDVVR